MNLYPKNKLPVREVKKFIVIFYFVGIAGFVIPFTKDVFIAITPLALIISTYLLLIYHESYTVKTIFALALICLLGLFIEVLGVKTGYIFGNYTYGNALGPKIFSTPIIIGFNWLFLTYTSMSIVRQLKINRGEVIFLAPLLMVIFDIVLEQLALKMDMWKWQNDSVPFKNYIAWYLIGLCFVIIIKLFKIDTKNPLASILFTGQLVFFLVLYLLLK
jgi:putative membrane protein